MRSNVQKRLINEHGITLVEVLVSIVLLTLVLTAFLTVFVQSATINKTSEEIIDATYIAQTEMEKIFDLSKKNYEDRKAIEAAILGLNFPDEIKEVETENPKSTWGVYGNKSLDPPPYSEYYTKIRLGKDEENGHANMYRIIVEVYQSADDTLQAKMQNVLVWGSGK